jgi:hypothetical protein
MTDNTGRRAPAWPWRVFAGGLALFFGTATLVEGGTVLFGDPAARAAAGQIVPFVLVFNFGSAFVYLATGAATLTGKPWAVWLARLLAASTALIFGLLILHVVRGGAYETRTVGTMAIRTTFWVLQAVGLATLFARTRRFPRDQRQGAAS